jgi:hypothetical protein
MARFRPIWAHCLIGCFGSVPWLLAFLKVEHDQFINLDIKSVWQLSCMPSRVGSTKNFAIVKSIWHSILLEASNVAVTRVGRFNFFP